MLLAVRSSWLPVTPLALILSFEVSQRSQGRDQGLRTGARTKVLYLPRPHPFLVQRGAKAQGSPQKIPWGPWGQ